MKKYLPQLLCCGAGVLGGRLLDWALAAGVDEKGLYPAGHPGWVGYLILTAAVAVLFYLLSRRAQAEPPPREAPVATLLGAAGFLLALIAPGSLPLRLAAALSAAALAVQVIHRRQGKTLIAELCVLPCLYFALQLFLLAREYSGETELIRFLPQALAAAAAAIAAFRLWGQCIGMTEPRGARFWRLCAGYLCIAAVPGSHVGVALLALWLMGLPCREEAP